MSLVSLDVELLPPARRILFERPPVNDFSTLYSEYHPKVLRYLTHLVGADDAEDLAQTVMLKVSHALDQFRGEAALSTWIYRIATNTAHDHVATSTRRQRLEMVLDDEISLDDFPDESDGGTDGEYLRREMNACIHGIIATLPENYRTVLLLGDIEGLCNGEIAAVLDLSLNTVKIRLHRGRTALRKGMEAQCSFYHDERNALMCDRKEK